MNPFRSCGAGHHRHGRREAGNDSDKEAGRNPVGERHCAADWITARAGMGQGHRLGEPPDQAQA